MPHRHHRWVMIKFALLSLFLGSVLAVSACLPATAAPRTLLVFGDSLTAGLGLSDANGFVAQLQGTLDKQGRSVKVINGSVSGDTTASGRARLTWALGDSPDAVLLELGANDMLQGVPVKTTRANLDAIMATLAKKNLPVLIAGMQANRGLGPAYVKAFDALYPALAKKYGTLLYPFFLKGVALDPTLNQADMMHPNPKGVAIIVSNILPDVDALLDEVDNQNAKPGIASAPDHGLTPR